MKIKALQAIAIALITVSAQTAVAQDSQDLLDLTKSKPQFSTLVKALGAAGLADTLAGDGQFTVFAPTDAAFAKLPPADLAALLLPENKAKLVAVLTYHVVPGKGLTLDELKRSRGLRTAQGGDIQMELVRGRLRADGARVTREFDASNGSLVSIDQVLMPK
jgi:uncharacterized surface protein with fasciclin (FAS1) repeats